MTARPKMTPADTTTRTAADLEALARRLKRATIEAHITRAVSTLFAVAAALALAVAALEFVRARHRADVRADCLAVADQFPDPADRRALIAANPACGPVVDVTRSR